jgi:zinc D-Ala-D-Ala carboxypeptidase
MTMPSARDVTSWLADLSVGKVDLREDNMALAAAALALIEGHQPVAPDDDDHLSPNFTLTELTHSDTADAQGIDNTASEDVIVQLDALANTTLEGIRKLCGDNAVVISSGYRCPDLNAAVGGASNSAHLYGCACDFTIPDFGDVETVCRQIEPHLAELQIDQLINEEGGGARWVHVGRAIPPSTVPRQQCFSIINGQTISGIV